MATPDSNMSSYHAKNRQLSMQAHEAETDALARALEALRIYYASHPMTLDTRETLRWISEMGARLQVSLAELAVLIEDERQSE